MTWISGDYYIICCHCGAKIYHSTAERDYFLKKLGCKGCVDKANMWDVKPKPIGDPYPTPPKWTNPPGGYTITDFGSWNNLAIPFNQLKIPFNQIGPIIKIVYPGTEE